MKKLFIVICALFVGFAYAANENVPTSKKFVDDALAQKQPKFDGLGNDKLMLYSNTTDGVVASRDIVTTLGNSTSADSVPTVGAINAGLDTKQDILNGDAGWVAENTGIAGVVVQKPIYSTTNNYGNALVEVETLNNAVINAVNSELTVVPGVGWTINTADNLNLLSVPNTYSQILPNGYTQLEYLESTREQYINTSIAATSEIGVSIKAAFTAVYSYNHIFGTLNPHVYWGINSSATALTASDREISVGGGGILSIPIGDLHLGEPMTLNMNFYNSGIIDMVGLNHNFNKVSFSSARNIYMFASNQDLAIYRGNGRIYYMKITDGNQLVRNFIPARRNNDNKLGMYDTVSGTFFTNAGTGTFTAGPDVN